MLLSRRGIAAKAEEFVKDVEGVCGDDGVFEMKRSGEFSTDLGLIRLEVET